MNANRFVKNMLRRPSPSRDPFALLGYDEKFVDEKIREGHTFGEHCPSCSAIHAMTPSRRKYKQRELRPEEFPRGQAVQPVEGMEQIILFPQTPEEIRERRAERMKQAIKLRRAMLLKQAKRSTRKKIQFEDDPFEPSFERILGGQIAEDDR